MHIRRAEPRDAHTLSFLCAKAFTNDQLAVLTHPGHVQYAADYRRNWELKIRERMLDRKMIMVVAETDRGDAVATDDEGYGGKGWSLDGGELVGMVNWVYHGPEDVNDGGLMMDVERTLTWLINVPSQLLSPDRSVDHAMLQKHHSCAEEDGRRLFANTERYWQVRPLGVHPGWQRRGVGTMLMRWGIAELAEKMRAPIRVESSPGALRMYQKLGFRTVGEMSPLVEGQYLGPIMRWDRSGDADVIL